MSSLGGLTGCTPTAYNSVMSAFVVATHASVALGATGTPLATYRGHAAERDVPSAPADRDCAAGLRGTSPSDVTAGAGRRDDGRARFTHGLEPADHQILARAAVGEQQRQR